MILTPKFSFDFVSFSYKIFKIDKQKAHVKLVEIDLTPYWSCYILLFL